MLGRRMPGIFISYRRDDSAGFAGRLADDLVEIFGRDLVFMDVTGIEPGTDFRHAIAEKVGDCDTVLAVIGKEWMGQATDGHARVADPSDFVRLEVAAALERGVPVIPVLVDDAAMPAARDLPKDLEPLAWRNAVELRHSRWDADLQVLVAALEKRLARKRSDAPPAAGTSAPAVAAVTPGRRGIWALVAGAALVAIVAIAWLRPWQAKRAAADPPVRTGGAGAAGRGGGPASRPIRVDGDVKVGTARYEILAASLDRGGDGRLALRLRVRMTNLKSTPDNFWAQSFRLIVDDAPVAPQDGPNEVIDGFSAKDGEVAFEVDRSAAPTAIQIANGKESTAIPIDLKATGAAPPPRRAALSGPFPMTLAPIHDVRENDVIYRFLSATIARRNAEQLSMTLDVRALNRRTTPVNFWNRTFRLEVDGVPRAPVGDLNEVVDANSARRGEVEFVFDDRVETLALLVGDDREKARVPLRLTR